MIQSHCLIDNLGNDMSSNSWIHEARESLLVLASNKCSLSIQGAADQADDLLTALYYEQRHDLRELHIPYSVDYSNSLLRIIQADENEYDLRFAAELEKIIGNLTYVTNNFTSTSLVGSCAATHNNDSIETFSKTFEVILQS